MGHLIFFFYCEKSIEFVKKKKSDGHNFASIHSIINQNGITHMPVMLIGCRNFRSIILGVAFFLTNYFKVKFSFFQKSKKKYFHAFFFMKKWYRYCFFSFKKVY